ncbi:MAG: phage holin family protein [Phycisphaeraceae bacterium]|nr:phage holin family protein [Phycisphaeraceae bacterium]
MDANEQAKISADDTPRCGVPGRDFGEFITSRGVSGAGFYARLVFAVIAALFGVGLMTLGFFLPASSKSPNTPSWLPSVLIGAVFLGAALLSAFKILYSYDFYESGLVRKGPRRTDEFAYEEVDRFMYNLVRHYHNGVYTGTIMTVAMWMEDGRKFSYGGKHKEKRKGFLKSRFEGEDEMDFVREAIEIHVAERIEKELAERGRFEWCKSAEVSRDGITPKRGKRKQTLVRWSELSQVWMHNGHMHIAAAGEKKSFIAVPSAGVNFFPCARVFARLAEDARGEGVPKREDDSPVRAQSAW